MRASRRADRRGYRWQSEPSLPALRDSSLERLLRDAVLNGEAIPIAIEHLAHERGGARRGAAWLVEHLRRDAPSRVRERAGVRELALRRGREVADRVHDRRCASQQRDLLRIDACGLDQVWYVEHEQRPIEDE